MSCNNLEDVLEKTIESTMKRKQVLSKIKTAIKNVSLHKEMKGLILGENDPSYKHRYRLAVELWKEATGERVVEGNYLEKIREDVKVKLEEKKTFFIQDSKTQSDNSDASDGSYSETNECYKNPRGTAEKPISGYVTMISPSKIFVKPVSGERELEVTKHEIIPIAYGFIKPGDKVEVTPVNANKEEGIGKNLTILKLHTDHSSEDENNFIENLKSNLLSETSDALTVYLMLERCKGIWDYIKNDGDQVKNVLKVSTSLSQKLSSGSGTACRQFLEDLSSSSFFVTALPKFINDIKTSIDHPDCSEEISNIEILLKLVMEFFPSSATKVFKVAQRLANALIDQSENTSGPGAPAHKNCHRGTQLLADLGESLAKYMYAHIPDFQEKDTTHSTWDELPTIMTPKEIFTEHDISGLQAIKCEEPYDSKEQYLETNHRLLREECFRNLYSGIQRYCKSPAEHDPRKMRMFKITLLDLCIRTEVSIMLNYEICGEPDEKDSEQKSKDILCENLMCISLEHDDKKFEKPIWATVASVPEKDRKMFADKKIVCVKLYNKLVDAEVLLKLRKLTQKGDYALMAESPVYFQAFGPCMERLIQKKTSDDLPFEDEIVSCKKSKPPEYTTDKEQKCNDWSIIFKNLQRCDSDEQQRSPVDTFKLLKSQKTESELDNTQLQAIETVLEHRVAIVQGPPGTGKSFLGKKILQLMLSMEIQKRHEGPILVMTYKNVALDHFLKTCLKCCPKMLRIGNSGELKEISLYNACRNEPMNEESRKRIEQARENMKELSSKLKKAFSNLKNDPCFINTFLQNALKGQISSLLRGSKQCGNEKVEKLLSQWEEDIKGKRDYFSKELRVMVKTCLIEWLPKEIFEERKKSAARNKTRKTNTSKSCSESKDEDDNYADEAVDLKVAMNDRMQDADEEDEELLDEEDEELPDELNKVGEESADDINIPLVIDFTDKEEEKRLQDVTELWEESPDDRLDFVHALQYKAKKCNIEEFKKSAEEYDKNLKIYQAIREQHTVNTLKKYDVIGMTISGAAMRLRLLNQIKPCAVIVEEAAEILEGQLIAVLPPSVKHLVMLGDQKQLKPSVSCYELKRDKKLDCSMFERLINNGLDYKQLGKQCRMRADIAQLLDKLEIYDDLSTNEEQTSGNEPPECVGKSMFFLSHNHRENEIPGTTSKYNRGEIKKIIEVAKYLIQNNCLTDDIAVLSPYRGQVEQMQKGFKEASEDSECFAKLKDIKITTVDSFQGEEKKIILLSLVRSNPKMRIGFFAVENRICVAVSRAKCALYIFGNSIVYKHSKNWKAIIEYLEQEKLVGSKFPFKINDKTRLFEKEIARISIQIVKVWSRLGSLLDIDGNEQYNIRHSNCYPEEKDKAQRMLTLYNGKHNFSRETLGECLDEVKLPGIKDEMSSGKLRE